MKSTKQEYIEELERRVLDQFDKIRELVLLRGGSFELRAKVELGYMRSFEVEMIGGAESEEEDQD